MTDVSIFCTLFLTCVQPQAQHTQIPHHYSRYAIPRGETQQYFSNSRVVVASWYGPGFSGHKTASGERFRASGYTAAHRSLPFGTHVRVTNLSDGRSVVVRINDRGPFVRGRSLDLSKGSAMAIGMLSTSHIGFEVLD